MISDSIPWKDGLLRSADQLERRAHQKRWTGRSGYLVERDVMLGAYSIRKLLDTPGKISDSVQAASLSASRHQLTASRPPDFWSIFELWEHYDLNSGAQVEIHLREFCNQVIHSLAFQLNGSEDGTILEGVFVCSDRESRTSVLYFAVSAIVEAFRVVGRDDVISVQMQRESAGQMKIISAESDPTSLTP